MLWVVVLGGGCCSTNLCFEHLSSLQVGASRRRMPNEEEMVDGEGRAEEKEEGLGRPDQLYLTN